MAETRLQEPDDATLLQAIQAKRSAAAGVLAPNLNPDSGLAFDGRPAAGGEPDDETLLRSIQAKREASRSFGTRALDTVTGFIGDTAQSVSDAFTGNATRSTDAPELPQISGLPGLELSFARGDLGKLQILRDKGFEVPARIDEFGNVLVTTKDGKEFHLNSPGLSNQDTRDFGASAVFELAFALPAARLARGAALVTRSAATGLGVGSGSIAQDLAAQGAGSEQPIDLQMAGISALAGGAFEFAAPLLKPFFRKFFSNPNLAKNGQLTDAGQKVLNKLGIDSDEIVPEFAERFQDLARDAIEPGDLATAARQAGADEFDIRLSRGDASGEVVQQGREDLMLKGGQGDSAANTLRGFRAQQGDDILAARGRVQDEMGTGSGLEPNEGIRGAQEALAGASQAERAAIREAYDVAGQKQASVLSEGVKDLARRMRQSFGQAFSPTLAPKAASLVKRLSNFESAFPGRVKSVNVKALEDFRKQIAALARSSDGTERAAAANLRTTFDDFMGEAVDKALVSGDTEALEAFAKARSLRRQFAQRFEGDKLLERLIEQADGTLKLEPSEAARVLFGASKLGGKTGATRTLRRMKAILGEDSPEWKGLREESFLRLFPNDPAAIGKFPGNMRKALKDAPELMRTLFSRAELAKLRRFKAVISNITKKAPGAVNFSNTTAAMSRLVQDVFGAGSGVLSFVARLPILKDFARAGRETLNDRAAKAATRRVPAPQIGPPAGFTGGIGSAATVDDRDPAGQGLPAALVRRGPPLKQAGRERQALAEALPGSTPALVHALAEAKRRQGAIPGPHVEPSDLVRALQSRR